MYRACLEIVEKIRTMAFLKPIAEKSKQTLQAVSEKQNTDTKQLAIRISNLTKRKYWLFLKIVASTVVKPAGRTCYERFYLRSKLGELI